ncbi:MAG TPA: winged helix-turn-helix domain-containing protein [Caulobacteraceae bacterium]|jgi:Tol biopolymer transport system component/DNA-binding winged helix-turn-helix (wHTH) protein
MADAGAGAVSEEAIRLSDEPAFRLGVAQVLPSTGELRVGTQVERLEPRVMQVLVALARAEGEVVSRESLARSCWGGRVVGDDAINRTLSTLRAVARRLPAPVFEIETLPRIGYRLKTAPDPPPTAQAPSAGRSARRPVWPLLAAAAFVLAAVAAAAVLLNGQGRGGQDWEVESYRVAVGSGVDERSPSLSPDGRFLAYAAPPSGADGPADIYVQGLAGGAPVRLVASPEDDIAPAWAPWGDHIAFVRSSFVFGRPTPGPAKPCGILVKTVPNGPERLVGQCTVSPFTSRVSWTPDGKSLVFSDWRPGAPLPIVRLDIATGRKSPLTRPPPGIHGDFDGVVSPDGRTLAFRRYLSTQSGDIYLQDLRSGRLTRLTSDGGVGYIDWAPDGRNLIVSSERGGGHNLWRFPVKPKARPQRLFWGTGPIYRTSAAAGLAAFEIGREAFNIVRLRNGVEQPVTTGVRTDYGPDVSPAGVLAFLNQDEGNSVWLQRPGEAARKLTDLPLLDARALRWSPDGRTLALLGNPRGGETTIYLLDVETTRLRRLPEFGPTPISLSWTRDSRSLVLAAAEPRGRRLWRLSLGPGGKPQPISGFGWNWAETGPDAVYALREGEPGVWRLAPGSPPVRLALHPTTVSNWNRWGLKPTWTIRVSGDRLHIWETRADGSKVDHWSVPLMGGRVERGGDLDGRLMDFARDPHTGDMIAFKSVQQNIDIGIIRLAPRR